MLANVKTHAVICVLSFFAAYAANVLYGGHTIYAPNLRAPMYVTVNVVEDKVESVEPVPTFDHFEDWALAGYLKTTAPIFNVSTTTAWAVIWCESNGASWAQSAGSTAYGVCQFLDRTWSQVPQEKTSDPYEQLNACLHLMSGDPQLKNWLPSQSCWHDKVILPQS